MLIRGFEQVFFFGVWVLGSRDVSSTLAYFLPNDCSRAIQGYEGGKLPPTLNPKP